MLRLPFLTVHIFELVLVRILNLKIVTLMLLLHVLDGEVGLAANNLAFLQPLVV